jgi:alginate O-acetyltransferase complex protein AlgI
LLLWIGLDAEAFFGKRSKSPMRWTAGLWAIGQIAIGLWILFRIAPNLVGLHPLIASWLAMYGVVSFVHFGLSQVLSIGWRAAGISAQHIMHRPLFAKSLSDFWGRRWNLAFRDVAHRFVFQPAATRFGSIWATTTVFLVSGVIHDVVISVPAGGGFGLPTLYFVIQGAALLFERSRTGKHMGLGSGVIGRLFAAMIVIGPAGLLFHSRFIGNVVVPMLVAIRELLP